MTGQQIDRDRLRELAENATPGPWETFKTKPGRDNGIGSVSPTVPPDEAVMEDVWSDPADAAFIAAARTAVPALLDMLDQAEADRDWLFRSSRISKEERIKANARADQARAQIDRVRALHQPVTRDECCTECSCGHWSYTECPTVRALDGE